MRKEFTFCAPSVHHVLHVFVYSGIMHVMARETWTDERLDDLAYHGDDRYRRLKEENWKLRSDLSEARRELQGELRNLRQELREEIRCRT